MNQLILNYPWIKYLLPPLLGAVIGFFTNAVAIKMLFRPYRRYKIGPLKIPFTPGVIPRNRGSLAESIAEMVSRELLQADIVQSHLASPAVQEKLRLSIERQWQARINTPGGLMPSSWSSEGFLQFWRRPLARVLQNRGVDVLFSWAENHSPRQLFFKDSRRTQKVVMEALEKGVWLEKIGQLSLDDILTEEAEDFLPRLLESLWPLVICQWDQWKDNTENRHQLESLGRKILFETMEQLNSMQRMLLMAGKYDETLSEKMPRIVDKILSRGDEKIKDPQTPGRAAAYLLKSFSSRQEKRLGDMIPPKVLKQGVKTLVDRLLQGLQDSSHQNWLVVSEKLTGQSEERLRHKALSFLQSPETEEWLAGRVDRFLFILREKSLSEILTLTEESERQGKEKLQRLANFLIKENLRTVVEQFDVHALVVNRINSLDMAQVDRLIQIVIAKHLKWINIFGALLGALIGASQTLFF